VEVDARGIKTSLLPTTLRTAKRRNARKSTMRMSKMRNESIFEIITEARKACMSPRKVCMKARRGGRHEEAAQLIV